MPTIEEKRGRVESLTIQLKAAEQEERHWHKRIRELEEQLDEAETDLRPSVLPTPLQRQALVEACQKIHRGEKWGDHLGSRIGKELERGYVTLCSQAFRIGVEDGSGYARRGLGVKLWDLTDAEIETILEIIAGQGLTVTDHWRHRDGISVVVADPNKKEA